MHRVPARPPARLPACLLFHTQLPVRGASTPAACCAIHKLVRPHPPPPPPAHLRCSLFSEQMDTKGRTSMAGRLVVRMRRSISTSATRLLPPLVGAQ